VSSLGRVGRLPNRHPTHKLGKSGLRELPLPIRVFAVHACNQPLRQKLDQISSTVDPPASHLWPGRNWPAEVTCPQSLVSTPKNQDTICNVNIAARLEECHAWVRPRSRGCLIGQIVKYGCPTAIQGKAHAVRPDVGSGAVTNHQTRGALVNVVLEHGGMSWAALARSASPKHHRKPLVGGRHRDFSA
jgi:hypothetical protein